ncbi:CCA tRNA nucleotidyltransferase [Deinococcus cellulosilyticus]|uniref:HDIG domain-containing protein n=1 Tax=Deinococcus cellulosilyticus (strain DSM 18568 / NBRC 106333 / KACC 11606 / 5516J-15) TaxID=1223518 RepID=A0A511MZV2_DEIC1|nr:CCA tRNA nucleotidyltransferase [Deinococcus cellulosilyticus]GEM46082.1 HDIG domain-containing protein [Deinococcus cellulosilyticus NBRC 106333 = KACC 11606]
MDAVKTIIHTIEQAGGRCYQVGGALRDELLGLPGKDRDLLVTGLSQEQLKKVLPGKVGLVGASFEVFKVTQEGETVDVALPRNGLDLEDDLRHRDFTINALARSTSGLVDPTGGLQDLQNRILRMTSPVIFEQDPLRLLRAIRFVAKLDFEIEPATLQTMTTQAHLLDQVSPERVQEEWLRLLRCPNADAVLRALRISRDTGILDRIFPEFAPCIGFEQHNPHHQFTVDEHIFAAVHHAVRRGFSLRTRLALFFHDIAKPACFSRGANGVGHFYEHEHVGARMTREILTRLKFSTHWIDSVRKLVRNHMRPPTDPSRKALRRFMNDLGEAWEDALDMREADLAAHLVPAGFDPETWSAGIRQEALNMPLVATFDERQLALSGHTIMQAFQVQGQEVGRLKQLAVQAIIEGELENQPEAILAFLEHKK